MSGYIYGLMNLRGVAASVIDNQLLITPRACARGKVIGRVVVVIVIVVVSTKIAISRGLGT